VYSYGVADDYAPGTKVYLNRPIATNAGLAHPPYQEFFVVKVLKSRKLGLALEKNGDLVLSVFRKDLRTEPLRGRFAWLDADWKDDD
jgi:hypothetical protein